MAYVAYQGSPPAILDLAAGRIQVGVQPMTPLLGAIREGKVRPLAVTSGFRSPSLPDVPTVGEAGFADLRYDPFTALFGWRGMPDALRDRLAAAIRAIVEQPALVERLGRAGILARFGAPQELADVIARQRNEVQQAVHVVGLRS